MRPNKSSGDGGDRTPASATAAGTASRHYLRLSCCSCHCRAGVQQETKQTGDTIWRGGKSKAIFKFYYMLLFVSLQQMCTPAGFATVVVAAARRQSAREAAASVVAVAAAAAAAELALLLACIVPRRSFKPCATVCPPGRSRRPTAQRAARSGLADRRWNIGGSACPPTG